MKILRKNVDLDIQTIAVLQIEATLKGHGSLKPYLEELLKEVAAKAAKGKPKVYASIVKKKVEKGVSKRIRKG